MLWIPLLQAVSISCFLLLVCNISKILFKLLFFYFLELQRKVMFQLAEIKNLLIDKTAHFSNDAEEIFKL